MDITRQKNFTDWYQEVIKAADMAENSTVRGCMVIKPWGMGIWERMQRLLDDRIKATGHENCYFPLFVPVNVNALGWVFFANLMQIPAERMFVENVPRFGHAMSCDSAINLADVLEQRRVAPGDRFVMLSVGLGGHWCSALMER